MVATYVFLSFVFNVVLFEQPLPDLPAILAFAVLLPAWEACSCQNDNITLPVVGLAVSHLLF